VAPSNGETAPPGIGGDEAGYRLAVQPLRGAMGGIGDRVPFGSPRGRLAADSAQIRDSVRSQGGPERSVINARAALRVPVAWEQRLHRGVRAACGADRRGNARQRVR
jgi:hypothetical protein